MKHLIPYFIQQRLQEGSLQGNLEAYTLFVDLKGFTPLTESLMREGNAGAERLSQILNEIFDPLIRLVYARGGFIPYFAGDAFTAIFPAKDKNQSAEGLIQTAAMARAVFQRRKGRFGKFTIGLKFGLSYGTVEWGIVGQQNKTFYFRGAAIDSCAYCQTLAENLDIVIDGSLLENLPDGELQLEPVGEDAYRVSSTITVNDFPPPLECDELKEEIARRFLPDAVVDYKQEGEFRPVTSIFLSFEGVDNHAELDAFAEVVLRQTHNFSGYFKEIDFGDKGGLMIIFFGAPVAFENNVDRALEFMLSLREELRTAQPTGANWRFRAGLTVGTAYTGIVGGYERCQYACVGNRVNLAARLMTRAEWGELLVDEEIQRASHYCFVHTGNIHYKGIKGQVPTYKLLGRNYQEDLTYRGQFVAREKEMKLLQQTAAPLWEKKNSGITYLFGEAGVGKSRLTYELRKQITTDTVLQWVVCPSDQILHKPFNPFRYFLNNYFTSETDDNEATRRSNFNKRVYVLLEQLELTDTAQSHRCQRELERTRSVLAALVGLHAEDSLWEQLDAKGRYENTIAAVVNLLLAESIVKPLVIELEDTHWMDESSRELCNELARQMINYPIWILVTSRYDDEGQKTYPFSPITLQQLSITPQEIDLNILPDYAVRDFAENALEGPISEAFLALLLRTTNNNPFYLEQILEYFTENELLHQDSGKWTISDESVKLSNSINAILTARIDRLSEQVRETVKAAAVIGREFDVPVLSEVMRNQGLFADRYQDASTMLREEIKSAEQVQIWRAMNELRYIFRHSLLREAVYSMQLVTRLKQLHKLIAEAIERVYAWQLESRYVDLAFHYEQAGVFDKTCEYLRKAADHARHNYQNQQALKFYDKLLGYLDAKTDSEEEIRTHLKRGKLLQLVGQWKDSQKAFTQALELAKLSRDVVLLAGANNHLGHLLLLRGEYDKAGHYLEIAAGLYESVDEHIGFAKVHGHLGNLHLRRGEYQQAQGCFEQSLASGYADGATSGSAQVVANLALTHMNQGQLDDSVAVIQHQLPLHRKRNDKQGLATLLVNLGIVQYAKGDYEDAGTSYREGLALAEELGNKQLVSIALGSLGLVIQQQGDYEQAMELFRRDLVLTEELGDKQGIAIALGLVGELLKLEGHFTEAIEYLDRNLSLCEELSYQKGIAKALNNLGDVYYFTEDYERSLHYYDRAIAVTRHINHKIVLCSSLIEKGLVLVKLNEVDQLTAVEEEALALAQELGNPDLLFLARTLQIRTLYLTGSTYEAKAILNALITDELDEEQRAEAAYLQYRLDPTATAAQAEALRIYTALYAHTPQYLYRKRLEQLEN